MKTSSVNQYDKATAHYILRPGDRPDFKPRAKQEAVVYQPAETQHADLQLVLDASDILFDFDKWVIRAAVVPELDQWADYFQHNPQVTAEIDGHTDSIGPSSYNQTLSERRAEAVKNYLIKKGVDPKRFVAKGFGESQPVAPNTTSEGRQKNRRVELKY
jgi:outer membrane protein OmpA-like peptidoglycan-associated protein